MAERDGVGLDGDPHGSICAVMATQAERSSDARRAAAASVAHIEASDQGLLRLGDITIAPALEQVLFTWLRASVPNRSARSTFIRLARLPHALVSGLAPTAPVDAGDVMLLVTSGVHHRLFAPVADALMQVDPGVSVRPVTAGRAARDPRLNSLPRLEHALPSGPFINWVRRLLDPRRVSRATAAWDKLTAGQSSDLLRVAAHDAMIRLAIEAGRIDTLLGRVRPRLAVAYDEIDTWGRLLSAVARARGIPTLDLPHAEAVDVEAIRGAAYDTMAVFGRRSSDALRAAGVQSRVVEVGAPHFDSLIRRPSVPLDRPRRVVVAGQYRGGRMTDAVSFDILRAAAAAAKSLTPAILQIRPHPTEGPARWERMVVDLGALPGVDTRIEPVAELGDLLSGAALLVTGWSNTVYESVLARVPAMTVHTIDGPPPMPFAAESMSVEARTPADAARLAGEMVAEPRRSRALERASAALEPHLGPLDGRAAKRAARLVHELIATPRGRPSA